MNYLNLIILKKIFCNDNIIIKKHFCDGFLEKRLYNLKIIIFFQNF